MAKRQVRVLSPTSGANKYLAEVWNKYDVAPIKKLLSKEQIEKYGGTLPKDIEKQSWLHQTFVQKGAVAGRKQQRRLEAVEGLKPWKVEGDQYNVRGALEAGWDRDVLADLFGEDYIQMLERPQLEPAEFKEPLHELLISERLAGAQDVESRIRDMFETIFQRRGIGEATLMPEFARGYGIEIPEGYQIRGFRRNGMIEYSFITPQGFDLSDYQERFRIDPEGFVTELYEKSSIEDAEAVLSSLGIPYEVIAPISQEAAIAGFEEERVSNTIQAVFPDFTTEDLSNLLDENPELFWDTIQTGDGEDAKVELLKMLGLEQEEIGYALRFQKTRVLVDGQGMTVSVDLQNQVAYDERGDFVGRYNPATGEFTKVPQEAVAKDIWDWLQWTSMGFQENIENFFLTVVPNMFLGVSAMRAIQYPYRPPPAFVETFKDNLRQLYADNKARYDEWELKHPELKPPADYQEGAFKHPELLKDPKYYAYELANITPFLITAAGMAVFTGGVGLPAILGTAAVMTPIEGQEIYEDIIAAGGSEDNASSLALVAGGLIGGLESIGRIPLLKQVSPLLMRTFKKEVTKELVKKGMAETIKRFGRNFTVAQFSEVCTEVMQEVVSNTAVSFFDENRSILDNLPDIATKTAVATLLPSTFGAGVSVRQVAPSVAEAMTDAQKKAQGWIQDIKTGKWYEALKAEEGFVRLPGEGRIGQLRKELARLEKDLETGARPKAVINKQIESVKAELSRLEAKAEIPITEPAMPEAGLQPSMIEEVPAEEIRPTPKAEIVQISMEDQLKLEQARERVKEAPEGLKDVYEAQASAEELRAAIELDPVANYKIEQTVTRKIKKPDGTYKLEQHTRRVGLESLISIREQEFPSYFTVKQAKQIQPEKSFDKYLQQGTKYYNRVPRDEVLDYLCSELGVEDTEALAERVMQLRKTRQRIKALEDKIVKDMSEKPLPARVELTPEQVRSNWEMLGKPRFTMAQVDALNGVFAEYLNDPNVLTAWELTRELRRETRAGRAQDLKARAQQLIVDTGLTTEEAMKQAITETMSGELPRITTEYLEDFTEDMREALFSKVYYVLKGEPFEMMSTITALTNALTGRPIPREPGVRGGSAYLRLQRVFNDQPLVLKAIDKIASEKKPLDEVIDTVFHEGVFREGAPQPPVPIDQETAEYLRKLSTIPNGYKTLLEPPFDNPQVSDMRTPQELAFAKAEMELGYRFANGELNLDEYQLERMKARDSIWPPIPPTRFDKPVADAFKEPPMFNFMEQSMLNRILKEIGWFPIDIGNAIRAMKASFDQSFLRQAKVLSSGHPVVAWNGHANAWKAMFSQRATEASWHRITHEPLFQIYEQIRQETGNDPLRVPSFAQEKGTERYRTAEEFGFPTVERLIPRLVQKIPWIKWSERAFVTGTNEIVWGIWKLKYQWSMRYSEKIASGQIKLPEGEAFDLIAEMEEQQYMLGNMIQRANLRRFSGLAPAMNAFFFAARSKVGRFLVPIHLIGITMRRGKPVFNPRIMKEAWKDWLLMNAYLGGMLFLGQWLGLWEVDDDPRSGEFMSARIGKMRIDPWTGYRQFAVLYARIVTGTGISSVTGAEYDVNKLSAMQNFIRSSLSPMASILIDFWTGRNFLGMIVDVTDKRQWLERALPFSVVDVWEAFEGEGWKGAAIATIPAIYGEGVQTYTGDWEENWTKLGLPKYIENTGYGITNPRYDMQDFYADHSAEFEGVDPESLTERKGYPPYIKLVAEVKLIKEEIDELPNIKLISIHEKLVEGKTIDDLRKLWQERQKLLDAGDDAEYTVSEIQPDRKYKEVTYEGDKAVSAFDRKEIAWVEGIKSQGTVAALGNMTQNQYALLMEYMSTEDEQEQKEFLEKHESEIGVNPTAEYYRKNPKDNALVALFGQVAPGSNQPAKLYTREAFDEFKRIATGLGIPESAMPEHSLPPEGSIDNHFARLEAVDKYGANSPEAMVILKRDNELREWLELDEPEQPIRYYELKAKNRNEREFWADLSDKDSGNYIEDENIRRVKFNLEFPDSEYWDDDRRCEAIAKGFPDNLVEAWVERGRLVDKYSPGSPKVKEWAFDNPNAYKKSIEQKLLTDKGGLPNEAERSHYEQWVEPAIRLQAKNIAEDKYWEQLGDKSFVGYVEDEVTRKQVFSLRFPNSEYFDDMEMVKAYKAGFSDEEAKLWDKRGDIAVKYDDQSPEVKVFMLDHRDLMDKAIESGLMKSDPADWNESKLRLQVKWRPQLEEYDAISDRYRELSIEDINNLPVPEDMNTESWNLKSYKQKRDWLIRKAEQKYLEENKEFAQGKDKITGFELGMSEQADKNGISDMDKWVEHSQLPEYGSWRDRYKLENLDWFNRINDLKKAKGKKPWDMPEKVPDEEYDLIYEEYKNDFEKWDSYSEPESPAFIGDEDERARAREVLILNPDGTYTTFGIARIERDAYKNLVPKNYVNNYVDFYKIQGEGKPDDYPETISYWEDNWYMMENLEFHDEVYVKLLAKEPYPITKRLVDADGARNIEVIVDKDGKITKTPPTREIGQKYIEYKRVSKNNAVAGEQYRANNTDLDRWGNACGIWSRLMVEPRGGGQTTREKFMDKLQEWHEYFEGILPE